MERNGIGRVAGKNERVISKSLLSFPALSYNFLSIPLYPEVPIFPTFYTVLFLFKKINLENFCYIIT